MDVVEALGVRHRHALTGDIGVGYHTMEQLVSAGDDRNVERVGDQIGGRRRQVPQPTIIRVCVGHEAVKTNPDQVGM